MAMAENIRIPRDQIPRYKYILQIYSETALDDARINMVVTAGDIELIKRVVDSITPPKELPPGALEELAFYGVMTSDPNDVDFLKKHPELCERCGWCCRNCNIEIRGDDILRLGSTDGIDYDKGDSFKMRVPCMYLKDNLCSVYEKRPNSCSTYPIGLKGGRLVVQRTLECKYIFNLLVQKVMGFCEIIIKNGE